MPIELGSTTITGRPNDLTLISVPDGTVIGQSPLDEYDLLSHLIAAKAQVQNWIFDSQQKIDQQHKKI